MKNIHLIPTDKSSKLGQSVFDKSLHYNPNFYNLERDRVTPQHLYITSEDEKIKEENWCLDIIRKYVYKESGTPIKKWENQKKIILTTDPQLIEKGIQAIDDEFLQWFVKNSDCEYVKVLHGFETGIFGTTYKYYPFEYRIDIPEESPNYNMKSEIINEMKRLQEDEIKEIAMYQLAIERQTMRCKALTNIINDLQSLKEQMFTKEEVLQIVGDCDGDVTQAKRTLEQFKEK